MEIERVFRLAETRKAWEVYWEAYPVGQEIMCLIGQCVVWMIVFYVFYRCNLFFQVRQREARQEKLSRAHRKQSCSEQAAVEHHWPWPEVQSRGDSVLDLPKVPRRRRGTASQQQVNPGTDATQVLNDGGSGVVAEDFSRQAPVMMCLRSCTETSCAQKLKEVASGLRAPRQDITYLEASGWVVVIPLHLGADTANKLKEIAAKQFCNVNLLTLQLGRWRACCLIDGEVKTRKLEDTDPVPVILHSSYAAGILTVEGLNLKNATIQIASSKNGDCRTLVTKCHEGAGGLERHTCICALPKGHSVAEVFMIAFIGIDMSGHELRVSSLPGQIHDDSLRTVLRDILPFVIFVFYATKQILLTITYASPMVSWLITIIIIASAQILSQSTKFETTIKLLMKITLHVFLTFYYAFQTFTYELKAYVTSMKTGEDADFPSIKYKTTNRQSSRKRASHTDHEGESSDDSGDDSGDDSDSGDHSVSKSRSRVASRSKEAENGFGSDPSSDNWQWKIYDTVYEGSGSRLKLRDESKVEELAEAPFEVVYLNLKNLPWANQVKVNVSSPFLKELLWAKVDRWGCKKIVSIDGPELYRSSEKLTERRMECKAKLEASEPSSSGAEASRNKKELLHINHLLRFMDKEFEEIKATYAAMKKERWVTWEMLWAFLPPGEKVVYRDRAHDELVCGEVLRTTYKETRNGPELFVTVTKWDYNCRSWEEYKNTESVSKFSGDRAICSINVHPLQFEEDPKHVEEFLLDNGRKFCELSMMRRNSYVNYKGSMLQFLNTNSYEMLTTVTKKNADGRVMIDLASFSKMNPTIATTSMGSAEPPSDVIRQNMVTTIDISRNDNRMFAPACVYGFSFRLKKWGRFSVVGFSEIEFNDSSYDDLVMPPATKNLTYCLVQEHLKEGSKELQEIDRVDPIGGKGEGCIILCYGPPGTGKTLTAESLSEKLNCPLWCLSAPELGITPDALEKTLVKVLEVAASWGAILLLDEADVYLERRSSKDLARNAMTGVFLRHLEYYRGVLFLTTNRDCAFDEAISSRITLFLYFGRHDEQQRCTIWNNLFRRVGLKHITDEILAEFAKPDFNGREIRTILKTAQTLARSRKVKLEVQHVREALTVYEESSKLRNSLNRFEAGAGPCLPIRHPPHDTPLKLQGGSSNSAPTPSELHPSSPNEANHLSNVLQN